MAEEGFKRKLTAILSADVEGYSRLMGDDEEATVRTLKAYREVLTTLIQQHNGKVLDSPGDNLLAEFVSVVDGVQCAVAVQKEIKARNDELPENRRMQFRIGINLGDVIQEEERIYGDGVNIAARLEGLADPGGICISKTAFDQIETKLPFGYEFLGDQTVKNITKPIGAYRVLMEPRVTVAGESEKDKRSPVKRMSILIGIAAVVVLTVAVGIWHLYSRRPTIEPASVEKMAFPLPDKPSIAVLPFNNLSGDPAQDYIADGISENIISALSKISEMFVIASNSTFTYKGKPVKVQQVSEELGVRYVLEGSTQKIGNSLRITAQLIDAITGHHLWSEKYDRDMKDLFELQDEIAHKIIIELQVKLTEGEQARVSHKSTTNLEAWSYAVRGLKLFEQESKENNAKAMELLERAVELDPGYVWAWVRLAWTHIVAARPGWSQSPSESIKKAVEISQKALVLDESDSDVRALLGLIYMWESQYEEAIAEGEKSLELDPANAQAHVQLAVTMNMVGRFDETIELVKKAMRLHPYYPAYYLKWLGEAYRMTGRYEDALIVYKQLLDRSRKGESPILFAHIYMAEVYIELGREKEARTHTAEALKFGIHGYKDPALLERRLNALRKAGLPEHPPLKLPDKPSIAVLAFDNLSGDPEQEYFSDGIAENIITALSKVGELFVIARNSSFTYKGKPVKVQQISRELGVRYVLEGSVRKSGDKVRITAQLIDAKNGQHLWAENYDRDFRDIFEIQDEITMKIVNELRVKLTDGERIRVFTKLYKSLDVYLKQAQANSLWNKGTQEALIRYGQLAQEIIDAEPESPCGYRLRAYYHKALADYIISPKENIITAFKLAQKALSIDESDSYTHTVLSFTYSKMREHEKAIASGKKSVKLDPNNALAYCIYGSSLANAQRFDEAIVYLKQAIRLNPFPAYYYYYHLGRSYFYKGQYEDALAESKKMLQRAPNSFLSHLTLAMNYAQLDRVEEARASAEKALEINPNLSVSMLRQIWPYKTPNGMKVAIGAMRKAGFPE
jgi:adenylate cyclase